jgi:hypothetical protein
MALPRRIFNLFRKPFSRLKLHDGASYLLLHNGIDRLLLH